MSLLMLFMFRKLQSSVHDQYLFMLKGDAYQNDG